MSVLLSRSYGSAASGQTVVADPITELALVAQGFGTAVAPANTQVSEFGTSQITSGGNVSLILPGLQLNPPVPQGPRILPNTNIQGFATLGTSIAVVNGTQYRSEIYVPYWAQWTGIGILNGGVVTGDLAIISLYDSTGLLVANSAVAGTASLGPINTFQQRAFLAAPLLAPGRYFVAYQGNAGGAAQVRMHAAANGGNQMTASFAATFTGTATIYATGGALASFTPPTTFTDVVGPIAYLYQ